MNAKHVVIETCDWVALLHTMAEVDPGLVPKAVEAPVAVDYVVIQETDPLAPQALYGYASSIRTAVEFTEQNGLCVMTEETSDRLHDLAEEMMGLGSAWYERQARGSSATSQAADSGTMDS